jgi:hypothetical protein
VYLSGQESLVALPLLPSSSLNKSAVFFSSLMMKHPPSFQAAHGCTREGDIGLVVGNPVCRHRKKAILHGGNF